MTDPQPLDHLTSASEVNDLFASNDPIIAMLERYGMPRRQLISVAYALIADRKERDGWIIYWSVDGRNVTFGVDLGGEQAAPAITWLPQFKPNSPGLLEEAVGLLRRWDKARPKSGPVGATSAFLSRLDAERKGA